MDAADREITKKRAAAVKNKTALASMTGKYSWLQAFQKPGQSLIPVSGNGKMYVCRTNGGPPAPESLRVKQLKGKNDNKDE